MRSPAWNPTTRWSKSTPWVTRLSRSPSKRSRCSRRSAAASPVRRPSPTSSSSQAENSSKVMWLPAVANTDHRPGECDDDDADDGDDEARRRGLHLAADARSGELPFHGLAEAQNEDHDAAEDGEPTDHDAD